MPVLDPYWASLLAAVFIILYGTFVEIHYVSRYSALSNLFALIIGLMTLKNIAGEAILVFSIWCILCGFIVFQRVRELMILAGSKITGAFLLALTLIDMRVPLPVVGVVNPSDWQEILKVVLVFCIAILVVGSIIGYWMGESEL